MQHLVALLLLFFNSAAHVGTAFVNFFYQGKCTAARGALLLLFLPSELALQHMAALPLLIFSTATCGALLLLFLPSELALQHVAALP